ncbi:anhydro-N-acetylmuramic acid kinase [Paracandidimonas soli]|uniref:anhydro-N-acetylmuramic acid kinase n=1 Tax=Paracandidimonas soli TaxID=1917182 RepID=UPI00333EAE87
MALRGDGLFIGLMSGTSTDGVDGVLVDLDTAGRPGCLASVSLDMPPALRAELLALNQPGDNELARGSLAANALADLYAQAVRQLLKDSGATASEVRAIGAHGQTVRHNPAQGYTIQINAPARLAEQTGIAVVSDFRSRDIAAGGQGAPLVPAFHAWLFGTSRSLAVVNLGGIANVSLLHPGQPTTGFDTGPANMLLDAWTQRHTGRSFDQDGAWAAGGISHPGLLRHLMESEPWLRQAPPKSTGRDLFNMAWLEQRLSSFGAALAAQDVQATLQSLTAHTVAQAIRDWGGKIEEVVLCGGGALNGGLVGELESLLPCPVSLSNDHGVGVQQMEAVAFAWLARAHVLHAPGNLAAVTGARGERILGCLYPA